MAVEQHRQKAKALNLRRENKCAAWNISKNTKELMMVTVDKYEIHG